MKKLILTCFAAILSAGIFASPSHPASVDESAKILKIFHQNFPEVSNHSIYHAGDFYIVHFSNEEKQSSCRIYYDKDGNVVQSISYYTAEDLSPFMRSKIAKKYKGKDIEGVTEVTNASQHYYQVIVQDASTMLIVHAYDNGLMHTEKKFKRAA